MLFVVVEARDRDFMWKASRWRRWQTRVPRKPSWLDAFLLKIHFWLSVFFIISSNSVTWHARSFFVWPLLTSRLHLSSPLLSHHTSNPLSFFLFIHPFNHLFNIKPAFIEHLLGDKVCFRFLVFTSQLDSHSCNTVFSLPIIIVTL